MANARDAAVVDRRNEYPVGSLAEAVGFLTGQVDIDRELAVRSSRAPNHPVSDAGLVGGGTTPQANGQRIAAPISVAPTSKVLSGWA